MRTRQESDRGQAQGGPLRPARAVTSAPVIPRAVGAKNPVTPAQVLALQGMAGNAAVVQRIAQDRSQDQHEHAAGCGHEPSVQRSAAPASAQGSSVADVVKTSGQQFDGPMRTAAESVYGVNLSHLRVHTDAKARESAKEVGAEAYTSRNHMVFGGAMTRSKVLHEVAHTFQQAAGPVSGNDNGNGLKVSDPNSPEEKQAAAMENASAPSAGIQRLLSSVTAPAAGQADEAPEQ